MKRKCNTSAWTEQLANWFTQHKRPLPWRQSRDPYRVWLSEIMLQQTQVTTVIPYYEKFLKNYPTVEALAAAPLDDVLKLWAGLGYYSRARNLHHAAQMVAHEFGGKFPSELKAINRIPGIGAYTAGAVLSIAFGLPEALVDGNVARVLSRVLLLEGDWRGREGKRAVWDAARKFVADAVAKKIDPGLFNQALMELGATICSPRSPSCTRCPIAKFCAAFRGNRQSEFPQLKARGASPEWNLRAWIVRDRAGKILLAQREPAGLFGGMWELPMELGGATFLSPMLGATPQGDKNVAPPICSITQMLTHRILKIDAFELPRREWRPRNFPCWSGKYARFEWLPLDDARTGALALHAAPLKILALYADRKSLFD